MNIINACSSMDSIRLLVYLENKINSGSPSGFSDSSRVLNEYSAGRLTSFQVPIIKSKTETEYCFLAIDGSPRSILPDGGLPVHPLFWNKLSQSTSDCKFEILKYIDVFVTASGRTVIIDNTNEMHFFKLHFPDVLGRVNRHIPLRKGIAGVEISSLFHQHMTNGEFPFIGLLPEIKCAGLCGKDNSIDDGSWAFVERCGTVDTPTGYDAESTLIPAFSMFAYDSEDEQAPLIQSQLCDYFGITTLSKFYQVFIEPLLTGYFILTFNYGLMPEINAQNLMFAFNRDKKKIYPVLRDMGRVEKLPYLCESVGKLLSCPYKTNIINCESDYAYVKTRHSFSFDFKLCGYIVIPMLKAFCEYAQLSFENALTSLSERIGEKMDSMDALRFFLPRDRVMKGHPKQLLTVERPYIDVGPPYIV